MKSVLIAIGVMVLLVVSMVSCSRGGKQAPPPPAATTLPPTSSEVPMTTPSSPSSPISTSSWPSPSAADNSDGGPAVMQSDLSLKVTEPLDAATITSSSITVTGQTEPGARVDVNDIVGQADAQGNFSIPINLEDGPFAIDVIATDDKGNQGEVLLLENVDLSQTQAFIASNNSSTISNQDPSTTTLPLKIASPVDGADISADNITVIGQTAPFATVVVNDQIGAADENGNFSIPVGVASGVGAIDVVVTDEDGNQNEELLIVNNGN